MRFLILPILLLVQAQSLFAQAPAIEVRAVVERRIAPFETPESARQVALVEAKREAWREVSVRGQKIDAVKAIPVKPEQIDALIPVIVEFREETLEADRTGDGAILRVRVEARISGAELARRLSKLRKDPHAVSELMETRKRTDELYRQLTEVRTAREQELLVSRINANSLVALVYTALARTEEGPASARVPLAKGLQRALQMAEIAVVTAPDLPETRLAMGDALMESNQSATVAEAEYRVALTLDPKSSSAHIKLAEALRQGGRLADATAELGEALRLNPTSPLAHTDLGFILASQQNIDAAIAEYHEALRLDADFIEAHNNLAIILARQQRIPAAVDEFREMVRIDPDSALGYYNLGIALADMEKDDESAEALRQVVRINPNHYNAHYNLGELFRLEGKFDEGVKQFREYLRLAPDTPQTQRNRSRAREFVEMHENP